MEVASGKESDDENIDYEDLDDTFIISSKEEDTFMKDYCDWPKSVDGGLKPPRSANQQRNVVMNTRKPTQLPLEQDLILLHD